MGSRHSTRLDFAGRCRYLLKCVRYEGIKTIHPHLKEQGVLGGIPLAQCFIIIINAWAGRSGPTEAEDQAEREMSERGEKTAAKVRYGQTISEQGYSGKTTEISGSTDSEASKEQAAEETRREQRYGEGSGVGA